VNRHSVISAGHYLKGTKKPKEVLPDVMGGRNPRLLMPIHEVSDVNRPEIQLSKIPGPPTSDVFDENSKSEA
jgi:NADH-quinone oxidoreductase subunit G